jgi:hypothetical protein
MGADDVRHISPDETKPITDWVLVSVVGSTVELQLKFDHDEMQPVLIGSNLPAEFSR